MKCPIDTDVDLVMTDRQGIEIDYCPTCRGVWLDRGELDKLIERGDGRDRDTGRDRDSRRDRDDDDDDRDERTHRPGGRPRKKRESFLGEFFDFG